MEGRLATPVIYHKAYATLFSVSVKLGSKELVKIDY